MLRRSSRKNNKANPERFSSAVAFICIFPIFVWSLGFYQPPAQTYFAAHTANLKHFNSQIPDVTSQLHIHQSFLEFLPESIPKQVTDLPEVRPSILSRNNSPSSARAVTYFLPSPTGKKSRGTAASVSGYAVI
mmetsp:Transcript_16557/g.23245  ORF Transcript_16557/g.23245 Transcript_16557/m.23245 type:complete len:133 (+) Transcript_16557:82-480(+)